MARLILRRMAMTLIAGRPFTTVLGEVAFTFTLAALLWALACVFWAMEPRVDRRLGSPSRLAGALAHPRHPDLARPTSQRLSAPLSRLPTRRAGPMIERDIHRG